MKFIDFFAGIGGFRRGMELAGHECVGFCEFDKFATASYISMHLLTEEQRKALEDIPIKKRQKEILKEEYRNGEWYANDIRRVYAGYIPKADCWCFGFPCQDIEWNFSNVQEDYSAIVDADGNVIFKGGANIDSESFISPTGNWTIDSDGFLTLIESATDASEKLKDFFTSPTVSSDDIIITGIKLKNRENEAMYGSAGYVLELENDLVADSDLDTVAAQIGDSIIGAKFRNMSGELAYNPLIEFGDMAYTYDRKWNRYITPLTDVSCSVNGKTTVKTQADDPIRGMSKFVSDGTKAIVEARRLVQKEKTAREKAVEKLEETLKNSSGLYETSVAQEDGSTIKIGRAHV